MGCHTWLHRKIDLTLDKAKKLLIKLHKNIIDDYLEMSEEEYNNLKDEYPYMYDSKEELIKLYWRRIKRIQNPNINPDTVFHRLAIMGNKVRRYNGRNTFEYCESDFSGSPFRVKGYPEDLLYSLEETLNSIKKYEEQNTCTVEMNIEYLKEFWNKYPDRMINFG